MKLLQLISLLAVCFSGFGFGQIINVTGRVINTAGEPVQGVSVGFRLYPLAAITDSAGIYRLNLNITPLGEYLPAASGPVFHRGSIEFFLESYTPVSISIYNLGGRLIKSRKVGDAGPGKHTLEYQSMLSGVQRGVLVVSLDLGGNNYRSAIYSSPSTNGEMGPYVQPVNSKGAGALSKKSGVDVLDFAMNGSQLGAFPIDSYITNVPDFIIFEQTLPGPPSIKEILQQGIIWYDTWELPTGFSYQKVTIINGISTETEWENSPGGGWIEVTNTNTDPYVDESRYLQYKNGSWVDAITSYVDGQIDTYFFNVSGELIYPAPQDFMVLTLKRADDLRNVPLQAADSTLRGSVSPDAVFADGSLGYIPAIRVLSEAYQFDLGYRSCPLSEAIMGIDGKYMCINETFSTYSNITGISTLDELMSVHSTPANLLYSGSFGYHFNEGTNLLSVYDPWGGTEPVLLNEVGTYGLSILSNRTVIRIYLPENLDLEYYPEFSTPIFTEHEGAVVQGEHYLPGGEPPYWNDQQSYAWVNDAALVSIRDQLSLIPEKNQPEKARVKRPRKRNLRGWLLLR